MIITIDGPTASGKSTIAYQVAEQRAALYINSGLLFRAIGYLALKEDISLSTDLSTHDGALSRLLERLFNQGELTYRYTKETGPQIFSVHESITPHLKTVEIDTAASIVALNPLVRQTVLDYQRKLANDFSVVADGRDCGTIVFPHATYKFYITASLEVRAARWQQNPHNKHFTLEECIAIVKERDARDSARSLAPLKPADDAFIIDTSHMSVAEVLDTIFEIVDPP